MTIYLVQHGDALDKETDPERPLSPKGIDDVQRVALFLSRSGIHLSVIWHSGKPRASQTAAILFQRLGKGGVCEFHSGLAPNDNPKSICRELERQSVDTAVVGHLPQLAHIAGYFLAGNAKLQPIAFERGAVVCLQDSGDGAWQVTWMVTPGLLPSQPPS